MANRSRGIYDYRAEVRRIVDGDTLILDVDLGFNVWLRNQSFRLLGCNARERGQLGGPEATANLEGLVPVGSSVIITSVKVDKYGGRFDAAITMPDGSDLSTELVMGGWAAPWTGAGEKPIPAWPRKTVG
jgi:endonuclease YncB( thermonuclease family)